jgi:SSS family solute:Na+ symporter
MAYSLNLASSVYPVRLFGQTYAMYAAIPALAMNLGISLALTLVMRAAGLGMGADETVAEDFA